MEILLCELKPYITFSMIADEFILSVCKITD